MGTRTIGENLLGSVQAKEALRGVFSFLYLRMINAAADPYRNETGTDKNVFEALHIL